MKFLYTCIYFVQDTLDDNEITKTQSRLKRRPPLFLTSTIDIIVSLSSPHSHNISLQFHFKAYIPSSSRRRLFKTTSYLPLSLPTLPDCLPDYLHTYLTTYLLTYRPTLSTCLFCKIRKRVVSGAHRAALCAIPILRPQILVREYCVLPGGLTLLCIWGFIPRIYGRDVLRSGCRVELS